MNDDMNMIPNGDEENEKFVVNPEEMAKRRPKKGLIIGIVAVVLALVAALVLILSNAFGSSGPSKALDITEPEEAEMDPLTLVATGFGNSIVALGKSPAFDLLGDVVNGGSMEVSVDLGTIMEQAGSFPVDGTASVKLYSEVEEAKAALEAEVEVEGITLDAGAYISENAIAVASNALLGKEAYGINLKDAMENFEDSEFGPNGEYSLGIELPEVNQMDQEKMEELTKSTVSMATGAAKQISKSFKENSEISKEDDTITIADEEIEVTAVIIEMDAEQVVDFADEMLQYIAEDEDFGQWLQSYMEIAAESAGVDSSELEEAIESFYEEIEIAKEQLKDPETLEGLEDASAKVEFYVTKSDKQLVGMDLVVKNGDEKEKVSIVAGPDWSNLSEISVCVESYGDEYCINYTIECNDKKEFLAKLEATENDEEVAEGELRWDKENGEFKLEFNDGYDSYYATGTMMNSDEKFEFFLQKIGIEGDEEIELDTTITLTGSDEMPPMPEYQDILTMSSDELEGIVEDIQRAAQTLMYVAA